MNCIENINPKEVFQYFYEISSIPRGSYDTKRISDYCVDFAKKNQLFVVQDTLNNVIIKKPATKGYEKEKGIILQGHLDMVCEKTKDSNHNFKKDALELYVEDEFVKAKDTTLGADNGIAIAYALAILADESLAHPALEAIFTVDEEVGMDGAAGISLDDIKGKRFINIDSDEEGILTVGCAGGFRQEMCIPIERESAEGLSVKIAIKGLAGGHSGVEIHTQRGNAIKLMGRILNSLSHKVAYQLVGVEGGTKDNVIPSLAEAEILIEGQEYDALQEYLNQELSVLKVEFGADEPQIAIFAEQGEESKKDIFSQTSKEKILFFLTCVPNGVQCYHRELPNLVETSLNLGVFKTDAKNCLASVLVRSSSESKKEELKQILSNWTDMLQASKKISGEYPGWSYDANSELKQQMQSVYKELFKEEPKILSIHAGLECGIFKSRKEDLDCVSFGPNAYDIHSVNERVEIASVERMWEYLKAVLAYKEGEN